MSSAGTNDVKEEEEEEEEEEEDVAASADGISSVLRKSLARTSASAPGRRSGTSSVGAA